MKANTKQSFIETGKNLGSGIVGMVAGSAVGRYSLLVGAATIFGGAYYQKDWVTSLGVGMVASNGFMPKNQVTTNGVDGFQDEIENAKDRAVSSLKALGKKLYIDKLSPSLGRKFGLGNLEDSPLVFVGSDVADTGNFDTTEVDDIISQLEDGTYQREGSEVQGMIESLDPNGTYEIESMEGIDMEELNSSQDIMELNAVA